MGLFSSWGWHEWCKYLSWDSVTEKGFSYCITVWQKIKKLQGSNHSHCLLNWASAPSWVWQRGCKGKQNFVQIFFCNWNPFGVIKHTWDSLQPMKPDLLFFSRNSFIRAFFWTRPSDEERGLLLLLTQIESWNTLPWKPHTHLRKGLFKGLSPTNCWPEWLSPLCEQLLPAPLYILYITRASHPALPTSS